MWLSAQAEIHLSMANAPIKFRVHAIICIYECIFDISYFVALTLDYAKHGFISRHQIAVVKHSCARVQFVRYAKKLSRSALKFYNSLVITFAAEYYNHFLKSLFCIYVCW